MANSRYKNVNVYSRNIEVIRYLVSGRIRKNFEVLEINLASLEHLLFETSFILKKKASNNPLFVSSVRQTRDLYVF